MREKIGVYLNRHRKQKEQERFAVAIEAEARVDTAFQDAIQHIVEGEKLRLPSTNALREFQ